MKDFLKKYEKRKILTNIYTVLWAFVLALSMNFLLFEDDNLTKTLKTSVLESNQTKENFWDFYLAKDSEKIFLKNSKKMSNVKSFSFSVVYDSENLQIDEIKSKFWEVESLWERWTWLETFIVYNSGQSLDLNEVLAEINFSKKDENKITQLNLINSNFIDSSENIYSLTTSWINL